MEISRKSWLYKVIVRRSWHEDDYGDICTFTRSVIGNLALFTVIAIIMSVMVGFIAAMAGDFIAWITYMLVYGTTVEPGPYASGVLFLVLAVASAAAIYGLPHLFFTAKERMAARAVYGAVTGKFCTRIKFKD